MQQPQSNSSEMKDSPIENSSDPRIGFGAADSVEQNEFDREQLLLSKQQLRQQVNALVRLYREQKQSR